MKVYGNIKALKESIEKNYEDKINEIGRNAGEKIAALNREAHEKTGVMKAEAAVQAKADASVAKARTLNEEKLKAKREFENEREKVISSVFEEVEKDSQKIALSSDYIKYVKSNLPKGESFQLFGGSEEYSSQFRGIKIDKKLSGILCKSEDSTYDFTINKMLESEKEKLREIAIKKLLGE